MTEETMAVPADGTTRAGEDLLDAVDEQLIRQLADRARAEGLQLTGEGGLLSQLTKTVVESALEGELDDHLGHAKHDPAGRNGENSRNGRRGKTVLTEVGPVEIEVPRDRDGSFEPKLVGKHQRRLTGIEDLVISLSAKGLTTGEIAAHLAEVYGAQVSKQTISTITDRVLEGMAAWQSRPLDAVYPVIFIDCVNVKIRDGNVASRPIYVALAVTVDGTRDILGLWAAEHGDGEGAKYWLRVLSEIKNRGVAAAYPRGVVTVIPIRWYTLGALTEHQPALDANLELDAATPTTTRLVLTGIYRPPPRPPAQPAESNTQHRVARHTAQRFLAQIAGLIPTPGPTPTDSAHKRASRRPPPAAR